MALRPLTLESVPVIRLPAAPYRGETTSTDAREDDAAGHTGSLLFTVDAGEWTVSDVRTLTTEERPDPAFRRVFHTAGGSYWLNAKRHRTGVPDAPSVLRRTGRDGVAVAQRTLDHDTFRSDVNIDGSAMLFLSRTGVLHGYRSDLSPLMSVSLLECPEYQAAATRFGFRPSELKGAVRCVAISSDRERYLFTVVDEAWCFRRDGEPVWGVRLPHRDGWAAIAGRRSMRTAPESEIMDALRFMQLNLPVSPEEITHQYRRLALMWHPDRNVSDPTATERMQRLNLAMELLTGSDLSAIAAQDLESGSFGKVLFGTPGRGLWAQLVGPETLAADWIDAVDYSASGDRVYLAGHSGKVVVLSSLGIPERVYDIGRTPRGVFDVGAHLYVLTDTRLYGLAGDRLECLQDLEGDPQLIATSSGFALLGEKTLEWHALDGRLMGGLRALHPIRRVFHDGTSLVVETRQHRAMVAGTPSWW